MVIFRSYVSLPEGIKQNHGKKVVNGDFEGFFLMEHLGFQQMRYGRTFQFMGMNRKWRI